MTRGIFLKFNVLTYFFYLPFIYLPVMYLPVAEVFFYHFQTFFLILKDIGYVSYTLLLAISCLFLIILKNVSDKIYISRALYRL